MSKVEFTDLTQPDPKESIALSSYFASVILASMSRLALALRLTEEEILRGALLIADSSVRYSTMLGSISEEKVEELRQDVAKQSEENYKKMEENGQLDEIRELLKKKGKKDGGGQRT